MLRIACTLAFLVPLSAQGLFRTTRHAGLPTVLTGDKYAVGDVDADGDLDIVVANDNRPNQLLLNDGRGKFVDATADRLIAQPGWNATHSVDLVDIDGDRDLDILFGNDDFISNRVYVNDGSGMFKDTTATALPPNSEWTQNQVVADFDGDGDVDWFTVDSPGCHLYRNDGTGLFTDVSAQFLHNLPNHLGERYQIADGADIDGDGDIDIMVPNGYLRPYLILNQGGGHLAPAPTQLPALPGTFEFSWFVDIDNDGDQDILLDRSRLVLQNQGNSTFVDVTATAFSASHTSSFAVFDVDGDSDVDMVTSQILWLNDGRGRFSQGGAGSPIAALQLALHATDFDGDGDLDAPPYVNFTRQVDALAAPTRAVTFNLDVHTRAGGTSYVAVHAALGASSIPLGALGHLRLDPASLVLLTAQPVSGNPLTLPWRVPNVARYAGMNLHFQAVIVDPATGPRLSNAIREVVQ